jgi:hypothetical protein
MEDTPFGSPGHLDPAIPSFKGSIYVDQVPSSDGNMLAVVTFVSPGDKRSYPLTLENAKLIGDALIKLAAAGKLTIVAGGNGHVGLPD